MPSNSLTPNTNLTDIIDDLCSRFIINVPKEELQTVERIFFQVEQAHWYYEDFIREGNESLPHFNLKKFAARIFKQCPLLHPWAQEYEKAFNNFMTYKFKVPVCGAIILNATLDKLLLVKGFSSRAGWGFPKGKINQKESDLECAIREVLEETGFDIRNYIFPNEYIEIVQREQRHRLYMITGVPESPTFRPRTRKEISQVAWHRVSDLPAHPKQTHSNFYVDSLMVAGKSGEKYFFVTPFVKKLKTWIQKNRFKYNVSSPEFSSVATSPTNQSFAPPSESDYAPNDDYDEKSEKLKALLGIPSKYSFDRPASAEPSLNLPDPSSQQPLVQEPDNNPVEIAVPEDASSQIKKMLGIPEFSLHDSSPAELISNPLQNFKFDREALVRAFSQKLSV